MERFWHFIPGNDDSASVCSFGSRADLDRLQEVPVPSWVQIGESVIIQSSRGSPKTGVVKFVGSVEFASGPWVGVELDLPEGMHALIILLILQTGTSWDVILVHWYMCTHQSLILQTVTLKTIIPMGIKSRSHTVCNILYESNS